MHPAPVKKHAGHEGEGRRNGDRLLRKRGLAEDNGRDGTVLKCEELRSLLREIHLIEKYGDTDADEHHRDDGSPLSRIIVVKWNHGDPTLFSSAATRDRTRQFGITRRRSVDLEWNGKSSSMGMASAPE